ncbi:hypothetical protein HanRHA438_Chr10g0455761 [Helianthus annuus]|nr:hypothetical protein HanIR_Chr10g0478111 [Helianthus annuus]KAJ0879804.1 hypothetical protein HanRHA438_Chr10g0455761 [Helianthus annuus]
MGREFKIILRASNFDGFCVFVTKEIIGDFSGGSGAKRNLTELKIFTMKLIIQFLSLEFEPYYMPITILSLVRYGALIDKI